LTHEDQQEQTGLSIFQLQQAKKELIGLGVLHTKLRGIPAKEFYYWDYSKLTELIIGGEETNTVAGLQIVKPLPGQKVRGLSPSKSATLYKENIYNNNKEIINIWSSMGKGSTTGERNLILVPLAEKLAAIIKQDKNINTPPSRILSWANDIRLLIKTDGVDLPRITAILDWYQNNAGQPYVPIIESGSTFRRKFTKLEDAMKRDSSSTPSETSAPEHPRKIIRDHFKDKDLAGFFYNNCYPPAKNLFSPEKNTEGKLAKALLFLHSEITEKQERELPKDLWGLMPGPMDLVIAYVEWIGENDWITNLTPNMLDISHTLFERFRRDEAKKDNAERDPLTGMSYIRG